MRLSERKGEFNWYGRHVFQMSDLRVSIPPLRDRSKDPNPLGRRAPAAASAARAGVGDLRRRLDHVPLPNHREVLIMIGSRASWSCFASRTNVGHLKYSTSWLRVVDLIRRTVSSKVGRLPGGVLDGPWN